MNQPQQDDWLIEQAGVPLERALFGLLVGVKLYGPISVGHLADGIGRDYTTVSRQVARLAELGLVKRQRSKADARINEATLTKKGEHTVACLDAARERVMAPLLARWSEEDWQMLVRLMRRFVDDLGSARQ